MHHHQLIRFDDLTTLIINQLRERESLLIHAMTCHSLSDAEYHWLTQHLMATRIEINRRMRKRPRM